MFVTSDSRRRLSCVAGVYDRCMDRQRGLVALRIGLLSVALGLAAAACAEAEPSVGFVGREACAGCHETETDLWQGSHHDQAMQEASPETVLGDFDDATLAHYGVTSRFFLADDRHWVRTEGPDGVSQDYEVAYTFGVHPLQQLLIAFPGGRYQALGIAWDSRTAEEGGQRWFSLYPDEAIPAGDPLHWTGMNQRWNFMCADCHSTNLQRNYDPVADRYDSTWTDIDVACEACHGPGEGHVAWAETAETAEAAGAAGAGEEDGSSVETAQAAGAGKANGSWPETADTTDAGEAGGSKGLVLALGNTDDSSWAMEPDSVTAVRTAPRSSTTEVETCGLCHSRRRVIAPSFDYGQPVLDTAIPSLLEDGVYFADGQVLAEDYVYGSFLQSRMNAAGVTCSICHEPHSGTLRAPGNLVCAQCHLSAAFDTEAHTHHAAGSASAECANCHMPTTTYMVVDDRHDHSIRVPRPDLSVAEGTPNACSQCHADRDALWAADRVAEWYGPQRRAEPHYGTVIAAGRRGEPGAGAGLASLAQDPGQPGIVRATALSLLPPDASAGGPAAIEALLAALQDEDALVRLAAVDALANVAPDQWAAAAAPLLEDDVKAVRISAARALAAVRAAGLTAEQQETLDRTSDELIEALYATAERPETQVQIGSFERDRGRHDEAEEAYRRALVLAPDFVPALIDLADLYRVLDRDDEAEPLLRRAVDAEPSSAESHHALGLLLVRRQDMQGALQALQSAVDLAPDDARYAYVHGVAANSAGLTGDALAALKLANARHPDDFEILYALATISRDVGDLQSALDYAEQLLAAAPNDPHARELLDSLSAR